MKAPLSEAELDELAKIKSPTVDRLIAEVRALRAALTSIAAYGDEGANKRLELTGSYSSFDEPGSVQTAREALHDLLPPA